MDQHDLFGLTPDWPTGFRYTPDLISAAEEEKLLRAVGKLPLREFELQGYTGKRRVISFGWRYDFADGALREADPIPEFLLPLRERAGVFAELDAARLQHVLVTEYAAGAAIGWHRDRDVFGDVIGVSLGSACRFRLRRKVGERWERFSLTAEPRSAYLLRGPSRTEWEHSIPPVDSLRYSITFRGLRGVRRN